MLRGGYVSARLRIGTRRDARGATDERPDSCSRSSPGVDTLKARSYVRRASLARSPEPGLSLQAFWMRIRQPLPLRLAALSVLLGAQLTCSDPLGPRSITAFFDAQGLL